MSEYVTLMGAEQVATAGYTMRSAAEQMTRAASELSDALRRHQGFMDDWLSRFAVVTSDARKICRAFDAADERDSTEIGV